MLYQCAVFQRLLAALHTKLPPKLITNPPNVAAASSNRVFVPPQSHSSSSSDLKSTKLPRAVNTSALLFQATPLLLRVAQINLL
jgi:hypothetical protein